MTLGNRSLLPPALRWRNWGSEIQRLARGHAVSKWWFWDAKTYHTSTPQSYLSWQLSMPFTLVHGSGNRDPGRGIDVPKMSQRASERAEIRTLASPFSVQCSWQYGKQRCLWVFIKWILSFLPLRNYTPRLWTTEPEMKKRNGHLTVPTCYGWWRGLDDLYGLFQIPPIS